MGMVKFAAILTKSTTLRSLPSIKLLKQALPTILIQQAERWPTSLPSSTFTVSVIAVVVGFQIS